MKKELTCFADVEARLNDGLQHTPEEHEKCLKWLVEFATANQMSLKELDEFCWQNSNWIFDQILG